MSLPPRTPADDRATTPATDDTTDAAGTQTRAGAADTRAPVPTDAGTRADGALGSQDEDDAGGRRASRAFARLRRGRRALRRRARLFAGLVIVVAFYAAALFADFIAPYDHRAQSRGEPLAPATSIHFRDAAGRWHLRPFVYRRRLTDPLARVYVEETDRRYPLVLLPRGHSYKLLGLVTADRHLFGATVEDFDQRPSHQTPAGASPTSPATSPSAPAASSSSAASSASAPRVYLLGADELGRDRFSRLLRASRFSLLVGPLGTLLASALGVLVGCLSGYAGRRTDALLMRAADAMMALPALVMILAARAAFPVEMPPARAASLMISIFVALGWAEMARLARGLVLQLRGREFVLAAVALGLSRTRILFRHILPNAARPLVVQASLMLPSFLLAETALSYLGVGVQDPEASWGLLLQSAANLAHLRERPFALLAPAFAIFLFVLGVRLVADGLRRAD